MSLKVNNSAFCYIRSANKFLAKLFWCSCNLHFLKHQTFLDNRLRRNQTQAQLTQKKSQLKADKFKNSLKEFLFSIRVVEDVVDAFDIFRTPGLQRIGRGDSAIGRHLIHDVTRYLSRCMRCRFASTLLRCIIVSRLFRWYSESDGKVDSAQATDKRLNWNFNTCCSCRCGSPSSISSSIVHAPTSIRCRQSFCFSYRSGKRKQIAFISSPSLYINFMTTNKDYVWLLAAEMPMMVPH